MSETKLLKAALEIRERAYAPYSKFAVGAALLTKAGEVFVGCNVENVSLRLTTCAEQAAVAAAIAKGQSEFIAIAVVANSKEPVVPCGGCRQLLAEFNPKLAVISATVSGELQQFELANLLPHPDQGVLEGRRHV